MMRVGEMGVVVAQRLVAVPVRVRFSRRHRPVMRMLVVRVVFMLVFVFQRFMPVPMFVPLAQVQPDTNGHQRSGNQ